jgi:hypothetical protein
VIHDPELVFDSPDDKQVLLFLTQIMEDRAHVTQPTHALQPSPARQPSPAWQPRPQKGAPSEASRVFLDARRDMYAEKVKDDLMAARNQPADQDKYKAVYLAFKDAFGRMLGETRAHCFTGNSFSGGPSWMQQQAAEDVTKAQWVLGCQHRVPCGPRGDFKPESYQIDVVALLSRSHPIDGKK